MTKTYTALGLMTGTSMDGVDCALIDTDGQSFIHPRPEKYLYPYTDAERAVLQSVQGGAGDVAAAEKMLTEIHIRAVQELINRFNLTPQQIDLIGFHGQTIYHNPYRRHTWQIGDGRLLATATGIATVNCFRVMDVAAGGQGAPLVPLYHQAKAVDLPKPLAVLNIGGVANVTWLGADGSVLAFDTGPGNALLDDWLQKHTGARLDAGGQLARTGRVMDNVVAEVLQRPFFAQRPPKSLDRHEFHSIDLRNLTAADGAATLTALTVQAIAAAQQHFPTPPAQWVICGGGRHNDFMMGMLRTVLPASVVPAEAVGWDGDFLEAEAFAYLAVRSLLQLPLTLPSTTGVPMPLTGGVLHSV